MTEPDYMKRLKRLEKNLGTLYDADGMVLHMTADGKGHSHRGTLIEVREDIALTCRDLRVAVSALQSIATAHRNSKTQTLQDVAEKTLKVIRQ